MTTIRTNSVYSALCIFSAGASAIGGAYHPTALLDLARGRVGDAESAHLQGQRDRLSVLVNEAAEIARDRVTDWTIQPRRIDFASDPLLQWDASDTSPAGIRWETSSGTITLLVLNGIDGPTCSIRWTDGLTGHRIECMESEARRLGVDWPEDSRTQIDVSPYPSEEAAD